MYESFCYIQAFGLVLATQKPHLFKATCWKWQRKNKFLHLICFDQIFSNIDIEFIKLALIWVQSHRFSSICFEMTLNFRWKVQLFHAAKIAKMHFFKMNVFWNSYLRGAKKIKERNQSEQDKIVFTELWKKIFRFNLSFANAELHCFLCSLLAGNTL